MFPFFLIFSFILFAFVFPYRLLFLLTVCSKKDIDQSLFIYLFLSKNQDAPTVQSLTSDGRGVRIRSSFQWVDDPVKLLEFGCVTKSKSEWTKSAIYNSPSLFARIVSLGRSGNSTSASDSGSNTSVSAGILPSPSTAIAPLLPTNFSEPPYSSSRIFAAAEEFLSDAPSVGDSDHPSVVQAGSYIDNLHTSPHSDESIWHSSLQLEDSTGFRALQSILGKNPCIRFPV